ncbi:MAG: hypothetical protein LUI39_11915 [Lachnospiraceae bacterium]|nr:hypothetical protein [Lachnospiraceae bacterium]
MNMVRLFNFKNNFLSDIPQPVSADYSVFGYYDGLSMKTYEKEKEILEIFNDSLVSELTKKEPPEKCDYYSIVGFCQEASDEDFWKKGGKPYIFISCLRILKKIGDLNPFMEKLNAEHDAVFYTTVDSSDLVVCIRTSTYEEGYRTIESYPKMMKDSGNKLQKGYSVFLIFQPVLDILSEDPVAIKEWEKEDLDAARKEIGWLRDEELECSIRCVVKDWANFCPFVDELKRFCQTEPEVFGVLGSEDVILRLSSVNSRKVLALFGRNSILTHGNDFYSAALYNARTEILVRRERPEPAGVRQGTAESRDVNQDAAVADCEGREQTDG